jgi:hypothetical protein
MTKKNTATYGECKACVRERGKTRYTTSLSRKNNYVRYGLTIEDVQAMFEQQRGLCACCGNPETSIVQRTGKIKMLHIDHDHTTGKVRGLLCQDCNMSLGHLQDSSQRIQLLLDYAKAHGL